MIPDGEGNRAPDAHGDRSGSAAWRWRLGSRRGARGNMRRGIGIGRLGKRHRASERRDVVRERHAAASHRHRTVDGTASCWRLARWRLVWRVRPGGCVRGAVRMMIAARRELLAGGRDRVRDPFAGHGARGRPTGQRKLHDEHAHEEGREATKPGHAGDGCRKPTTLIGMLTGCACTSCPPAPRTSPRRRPRPRGSPPMRSA